MKKLLILSALIFVTNFYSQSWDYVGDAGFSISDANDNDCQINDESIHTAVNMWKVNPSEAEQIYGHISSWNTSCVTNMTYLFENFQSFNDDIGGWDVSNVTDMSFMFFYAIDFNQDISNWDVSNVTDVHRMFQNAFAFNQDISAWDVSSVTNMRYMFYYASSFNQPLNDWDVSGVIYMRGMFRSALAFNQPIGAWDVSSVVNMEEMFFYAESFNQDLSSWCVTNITSEPTYFSTNSPLIESNMPVWGACPNNLTPITDANFYQAIETCLLTNPVDGMCSDSEYGTMPDWDVSQVTNMSNAFYFRNDFNADISAWNTSNVTNMEGMFYFAGLFNQAIGDWDVSSVTEMRTMFFDASSFNQDIGNWDVGNVTDMTWIFSYAFSFNQDIGNWDVSNVVDMSYMFNVATSFNQDISNWCVTNILFEPTNFSADSPLIESNMPVWGTCPSFGLDDQNLLDISIHPNPSSHYVCVNSDIELEVMVFDLLGKELIRENITGRLDISSLEKGTYILNLTDRVNTSTHKIIKE